MLADHADDAFRFVSVAVKTPEGGVDPRLVKRLRDGCFVMVASSQTDVFLAQFKFHELQEKEDSLSAVIRLPMSQVLWISFERSSPKAEANCDG